MIPPPTPPKKRCEHACPPSFSKKKTKPINQQNHRHPVGSPARWRRSLCPAPAPPPRPRPPAPALRDPPAGQRHLRRPGAEPAPLPEPPDPATDGAARTRPLGGPGRPKPRPRRPRSPGRARPSPMSFSLTLRGKLAIYGAALRTGSGPATERERPPLAGDAGTGTKWRRRRGV